jgi:hypothetical protein
MQLAVEDFAGQPFWQVFELFVKRSLAGMLHRCCPLDRVG